MATINGDFSIGNAYEYKPLQIPNMDKVFDGQRWAIERADKLKKEADVAAERKALKEAELAKDRNAEIAKEQTLLAQRLKFNTTGLTKEAEALVAKRAAELATLGGALGNVNDMTRPEVVQWNQDVDNLTNRIYEHQQYYNGLNKAATDYDAAVLGGVDVEEYNKQGNFEEYLGRIQKEGLDFTSPYMPKPIVKKPAEMTDAEWTKLQKDNHTYMESTTPGAFQGGAGNLSGKRQYTKQYTTKDNLFRTYAEGLVVKHNNGETTRDEEKAYRKLISEASIMGGLNDDGTLKPEYFAAIENKYRPEGGVETKIEEVNRLPQYITHPSEGSGKESTGLYTNKNGYFTWGNRKDAPQVNFQRENLVTPVAGVVSLEQQLKRKDLPASKRKEYEAALAKGKQLNNFPVVASIKLAGNASIADAPADAFRILTNGREVKPTPEQLAKLRPNLVQTPKVIKYAPSKNGVWISQQDWGEGNNELTSSNVDGFTGRIVTTTDDGQIVTINPIALGIEEKDYPQGFDQGFIANQYGQQVQTPVAQPQGKKTGTGYNRGSLPPSGK